MSHSTQKNGATRTSAAGYGAGSTWHRIAIREQDGKWRTLPFAKVSIAEARDLAGLGDYKATPHCFVAQQRTDSGETFLVFKGPQV